MLTKKAALLALGLAAVASGAPKKVTSSGSDGVCDAGANCFSPVASTAPWFSSVDNWSASHFPIFPESVQIEGGHTAELRRFARGAAQQVVVTAGAKLAVDGGGTLEIGPREDEPCDARCHAAPGQRDATPAFTKGWTFATDSTSTAMDKWCHHNCGAETPFCPTSLCVCEGSEYEHVAATPSSARACAAQEQCESHEFESAVGTTRAKRACQAHDVCHKTLQWMVTDGDRYTDRACRDHVECEDGHYQTEAPTTTSPRVCKAHLQCLDTEFETVAADARTNRVCKRLKICHATLEYIFTAHTTTSDRVCATLRQCSADQYQSVAPTVASNRFCEMLTVCDQATHYETVLESKTSDRTCTPLRTCTVGAEYEFRAPNFGVRPNLNRHCKAYTKCGKDEYETKEETTTTDRHCAAHKECEAHQFISKAAETHADRECTDGRKCDEDEFQVTDMTDTEDRVCQDIYSCLGTEYQTGAPDATTDRTCATARVCKTAASGFSPATEYQSTPLGTTTDRGCLALATCDGDEYESLEETETEDRKCSSHRECNGSQYQTKAAETHADRECASLRVCDGAIEHQTQAPEGDGYATVESPFCDRRGCRPSGSTYRMTYKKACPLQFPYLQCGARNCRDHGRCHNDCTAHQAIVNCYNEQGDKCFMNKADAGVRITGTIGGGRWGRYSRPFPLVQRDQAAEWGTANIQPCPPTVALFDPANPNVYFSNRVCVTHQTCDFSNHVGGPAVGGVRTYISVRATATNDRVCTKPTECDYPKWATATATQLAAATQYELAAPGTYSNRKCATLRVCDYPDTEWQFTAPTYKTNRKCKALTTCEDGQYESTAPSSKSDRKCSSHKECKSDQYESKAPTGFEDRECEKLTTCKAGQWESKPKAYNADRDCDDWKTCKADEYIKVAGTGSNDNGCAALKVCDESTHYESRSPLVNRNRECTELSTCDWPATQFELSPKAYNADRKCEALRTCNFDTHYIKIKTTYSRNRSCATLRTCNFGTQFESKPKTNFSNRECSKLTICDFLQQYQSTPKTNTSNRKCSKLTTCTFPAAEHLAGEYISKEATQTSNRECIALDVCDFATHYERVEETTYSPRTCTKLTVCKQNEFETQKKKKRRNRTCQKHRTCSKSQFISAKADGFNDRVCADIRTCDYDKQYQTVAPGKFNNRECAALRVCKYPESEYELTPKTLTSNRKCAKLNTCTMPASAHSAGQYVSVRAGPRNQRKCAAVRVCDYTKQFMSSAADRYNNRVCTTLKKCGAEQWRNVVETKETDRTCKNWTECKGTEYETRNGSYNLDRTCKAHKICDYTTQWESTEEDTHSDRGCTDLTVCDTVNEWEDVAKTETSDRHCEPLTTCPTNTVRFGSGKYITKHPTPTSDRECAPLSMCKFKSGSPRAPKTGEYESKAPTATSNRVCSFLQACAANAFESKPETKASDRVCQKHHKCKFPTDNHAVGEYTSIKAGLHNDRECKPLRQCVYADEYLTTNPGTFSDRGCTPLTVCKASEWQTLAKTRIRNRKCQEHKDCVAGEKQVTVGDGFNDRVCTNCGIGKFTDWVNKVSCKSCGKGKFQGAKGKTGCMKCKVGEYQNQKGKGGCKTCNFKCPKGRWHTPCGDAKGWVSPGTCNQCAAGKFKAAAGVAFCGKCTAGRYSDSKGASKCTACDGVDHWQPKWGKTGCMETLKCRDDQFETVAPTKSSNRQCQDHYKCKTAGSTEFETVAAGKSSDRECQTHRVCTSTEYETKAAGTHHNRKCQTHTICKQKEWEFKYEGTHHNRVCERRQTCHHTTCQLHKGKIRVRHHHKDHDYGFTHHHCKYDTEQMKCVCMCHNQALDRKFAYKPTARFFWKRSVQKVVMAQVKTGCAKTVYSPAGGDAPSTQSMCRDNTLGKSIAVSDGAPFRPLSDSNAQASSIVVFKNDRISWAGEDTACAEFSEGTPMQVSAVVYTCVKETCAHPKCCDCGNSFCSAGHATGACQTTDFPRFMADVSQGGTLAPHPSDAASVAARRSGTAAGTKDTLYAHKALEYEMAN